MSKGNLTAGILVSVCNSETVLNDKKLRIMCLDFLCTSAINLERMLYTFMPCQKMHYICVISWVFHLLQLLLYV